MLAVPEDAGVHWNTSSGESSVLAQLPLSVLGPLVAPVNVPPSGGTTVRFPQPLVNAAVYVVGVSGVMTVCVCAPPSDQSLKPKRSPPLDCGDGAPRTRWKATTPVFVTGVWIGCPSSVTTSPGGLVWIVKSTVWGTTNTVAAPVRPVESVARRMTS